MPGEEVSLLFLGVLEGERRTWRFVVLATPEAAAGAGTLANRGKSIRISPAIALPIQASTIADKSVNVFIFASMVG